MSRFNAKNMECDDPTEIFIRDAEIRRRHEIFEQYNGRDASAEWRSQRKRKGRAWVLEENGNQA